MRVNSYKFYFMILISMVWENELIVGGMKWESEHRKKKVLPKEQLNEIGHMIRVVYTPGDSPACFLCVEEPQRKCCFSGDHYLSLNKHIEVLKVWISKPE